MRSLARLLISARLTLATSSDDGAADLGRTGVITDTERSPGAFDVVHLKNANEKALPPGSPTFLLLAKATN